MKRVLKKTQRAISKTLILGKRKTGTTTKVNKQDDDIQAYASIVHDDTASAVVDMNASANETKDEHTSQLFKPDFVQEICEFRETYCRCHPVEDCSPIEIFQPIKVEIVHDTPVGPDMVDQETVTWPHQIDQNIFDHASDESLFDIAAKPNLEGMSLITNEAFTFDYKHCNIDEYVGNK